MAKREPKPPSPEKVRKDTLEALARYQKRGAVLTDTAAIAERLKNESDRGTVIILVTYVEDALLDRVLDKMNPTLTPAQRKKLTSPGAPLNSFAAVTNVALAMGLVEDWEAEILEVLKAMRNACAHSRLEIDFGTKELQQATMLLVGKSDDGPPHNLHNAPSEVFRMLFIFTATMMLNAGAVTTEPYKQALELFGMIRPGGSSPQKQNAQPAQGRRRSPRGKGPPRPPQSSEA
jgi:hypothetical protein